MGRRLADPSGPVVRWSCRLDPRTLSRLLAWCDRYPSVREGVRALLDIAEVAPPRK
jgi:hypothetical protein